MRRRDDGARLLCCAAKRCDSTRWRVSDGKAAGTDPTAIVLHDPDSLDFLGDVGAARMISLTGEKAASFDPAIVTLKGLVEKIPPRLITATAKRIGAQRAKELHEFIVQLQREEAVTL